VDCMGSEKFSSASRFCRNSHSSNFTGVGYNYNATICTKQISSPVRVENKNGLFYILGQMTKEKAKKADTALH
jgi:hypothetical protein